MSKLIELDQRHIWHPYTQHQVERAPKEITHANGAVLYDADGGEIVDMISSWWTCIHGHAHPALNKALAEQAEKVAHVMFSGFTHKAGVDLATKLSEVLPGDLNRVFFSDDGSTAVEVSLKMAYQYWANQGETTRKTFIAFDGAYHGDTFGAMAVGKGSGFFTLFDDLFCSVLTTPYAGTWDGDQGVKEREVKALSALEKLLEENKDQVAAILIEPLMQGAAGMNFCRPQFIKKVSELAKSFGILVIFDEVATGFGRTGTMFACERIGVVPDIICLSKGLTAGYMPMSVTVARDEVYDVFLGESFAKALAHGHSFTGNPLACALSVRSLELFEEEDTLNRIARINSMHEAFLPRLQESGLVERARICGSILACNYGGDSGYKSDRSVGLRDWYLSQGFNIRPIGSTLYLMPPYCISDDQLKQSYEVLLEGLRTIS